MELKVIAYYLPQFHKVEENDEWWEEDFTEWTNVRRAKSLFHNHVQPVVPLNENYYNLMEKKTVEWQTDLANEYGIYAFAYYHYWFNGRKILEKPAENLMIWKDIKQHFFFFWANHNWYKAVNGYKSILLQQTYGGKEDIINHYNYMRRFFLDERYLKKSNKPIIGIYMPKDIPNIDDMTIIWNKLALADGFDGVYIIESLNSPNDKIIGNFTDAAVIRQPNISMQKYGIPKNAIKSLIFKVLRKLKFITLKRSMFFKMDYEEIMKLEAFENIDTYKKDNEDIFFSIATGWDNTPRHGKFGKVIFGANPQIFKQYFQMLYDKSKRENSEFLFVNAWNEWAEGMYLEPDNKYKYGFLSAIKETVKDQGQSI